MFRLRRVIRGARASIDPLSAAGITAALTLLGALGLFFTRPGQDPRRAGTTDFATATSTTIPNAVAAGHAPDTTSSTTAPVSLGTQLPLTGGPLPPATARPSTTTRPPGTSATAPPPAPATAAPPPPVTDTTQPPTTTSTSAPPTTTSTTGEPPSTSTTTTTSLPLPPPTFPLPPSWH